MCIGPFAPKPPKVMQLPDLSGANRAATDEVSAIQEGRDAKTKDDTTSIVYGSNKKQSGPAAGKRTGTGALSISQYLNTGNTTQGDSTGGLNV